MTKLQKAVAAIKAGDKQVGEQLVRDILATEPDNEAAWLWLATVVNSRNEKIRCLVRVLEINPDNDTAQQGVARLQAASVPAASPAKPDDVPRLKRLKKAPQAATSAENAGLSWDEVWFSAISQPSIATFERILGKSQVSAGRAFLWLAVSSLVAAALGFMLRLIVERLTTGQISPQTIIALAAGVTVGPILGVVIAAVIVGVTQWVAGLLGGQGNFSRLIYAQAAYGAPLGIVIGALAAIPVLNLLNIILYIYAAILNVLAVQAVNRFSTGRAIAAVFIPGVVFGLLAACGIFTLAFAFAGVMGGQ